MSNYPLYLALVALHTSPVPFAPVLNGPAWLALESVITGVSGQRTYVVIWLFRGLALFAHLINCLLIWTILGKIAPARRLAGTLLYAWNPLVLIEAAVNGNAAGVVICLLLLAILIHLQSATQEAPPMSAHDLNRAWPDICSLVLVGLAASLNLLVLVFAPLFAWFIVRGARDITTALRGFAWRVLVVLAIVFAAYIPVWRGGTTLPEATDTLNLFNFAYSPLGLVVIPVRGLYSLVAQSAHFPLALMQPTTAADTTVLASTLFLFALLYLREMGRVHNLTGGAQPYETLLTSCCIVMIGFIVLVATVFWPWYLIWVVWIAALRRFDTLSISALLLSCTALLYYPLLSLDPSQAAILLPSCVFGIPLVYVVVQRFILKGRFERNRVLPWPMKSNSAR